MKAMTDRYERIRGALAMEPTIVDRVNAAAAKVSDVLMEARNAARDELLWLAAQYRELAKENELLRKDAERYRWLRKGVHDDIAVVRGLGAMDSVGGEANTYSKEIDGDDLDAAIDAAMSKEGKQ